MTSPANLIKKVWERIAPLHLAERSWDNVGLLVEAPYPKQNARRVLLTIDLTTKVCNEALSLPGCSLIVAYHPPIFRGLKSLTLADPLQASLLKLSAAGISVFAPHTSLDAIPKGINSWIISPFMQYASGESEPISIVQGMDGAGMGRVTSLKPGLTVEQAVKMVKEHLGLNFVQLATPDASASVSRVAVCAGSGGSVFKDVEADLLVTGEMSHHEVLAAVAKGTSVILCCHTNTERPYLSAVLQPWLQDEMRSEESDWEVVVSKEDADPLITV